MKRLAVSAVAATAALIYAGRKVAAAIDQQTRPEPPRAFASMTTDALWKRYEQIDHRIRHEPADWDKPVWRRLRFDYLAELRARGALLDQFGKALA